MRNWHYLHASRATGWPAQSVALAVVCSAGAVRDDTAVTRSARLLGWAALAWTGTRGEATRVDAANGIDRESFWRWITGRLEKGRATWVWQLGACAGLTALGFWDALTRKDWCLCGHDYQSRVASAGPDSQRSGGLCVVSDPPTILLARPASGGGSAHWLDLRNLSPRLTWDGLGVDSAGLGKPQGDCDQRLSGRELAVLRSRQLFTWLGDWYQAVRDLKLGGLRATAAAQAWHGWRSHYLACPVEVHNDEQRLTAEGQALYGGRCEAFAVGSARNNVRELDANGHYPAIASAGRLPGRIARAVAGGGDGYRKYARLGYLIIAKGRVRTTVPCLPRRDDGQTVYPVGSWRGTYCQPEIELLESCGGRFDCQQWWGYEPTDPFGSYYAALYDYRRRCEGFGKRGIALAVKLLCNSLIGRCAARERYWEDHADQFYPQPWAEWYQATEGGKAVERWRSIGWRVQREVEGGWHPESVPALAAWIYSVGRVRLWRWMSIASREEVYYCDTDSLWTTEVGYGRLVAAGAVDGTTLGALRQAKRHPWARFYGVKHYETPAGVVCAGVPARAVATSEGGRRYWLPDTPAKAAIAGRPPASALVRFDVSDRRSYRGGRIGADGTVYPFEVYDDG